MPSQDVLRDRILIRQALKGNQEAFQLLLEFYWNVIKSGFLRRKISASDAEDLTELTFSKAFLKLGQYKNSYAFSTWLNQIASNNFIDFLRKKSRRVVLDSLEESIELGKEETGISPVKMTPELEYIEMERKKNIRILLKKLKPQYYKLIALRFLEEKSYEEISKELDMPLGTVKTKLFRAKKTLKKIFTANRGLIYG